MSAPDNAPDFSPLASLYRWMEWLSFGPFLHRARCAFLSDLTNARNALILGDGDGRFTAALLRANSLVQIDTVDASPAMLRALLHRAGPNAVRIRCHAADARSLQPQSTEPYDLVVTHFFLDCLSTEEIRALAGTLRPYLAPGAIWLLSDFAIPPNLYGRIFARPLVSLLYRAFGLLTGLRIRRLPDHPSALIASGFTLHSRRTFLGTLLIAEKWQIGNITAVLKSVNAEKASIAISTEETRVDDSLPHAPRQRGPAPSQSPP
jgi:SAM-dependent methyltransferase